MTSPLQTTPAAPDCFSNPSSTLLLSTIVALNLVTQQSSSLKLLRPPRPLTTYTDCISGTYSVSFSFLVLLFLALLKVVISV